MLRFLTDELQEAEDAGDRGKASQFCGLFLLSACSLDFGTRSHRVGRIESALEPY